MVDTPVPIQIRTSYLAAIRRRRLFGGLGLALFAGLMVWGFRTADQGNSGPFLNGLLHVFDFPGEILREALDTAALIPGEVVAYIPALVETLNIAAVATLIGAFFGGLLSLLASQAFAPWPRLVPVFRRLMDIARAFPEVVVALVLIYVLGGGPVPAAIAISIHSIGALGKLFSEVNDNADIKPVDGLRAVGAPWLARMLFAVLPQVLPNWVSYALLRFEINIRASAILGFVGAGGLGSALRIAISWGKGRYDTAAAVFLLLILTIVVVDQVSSVLRDRLVKGTHA